MDNSSSCFVPGCQNLAGNATGASFHLFPDELQEEWLVAIGRDRDTFITHEVICSEHFKDTDYENHDTFKTLRQNVVPSLNLPSGSETFYTKTSDLDTSTCEEIEQLVEKYNAFEYSLPVKSINNYSNMLRPKVEETDEYENSGLSSHNEVLQELTDELYESSDATYIEEYSEGESIKEYCLEYDVNNCRTCLSEIGGEGGYPVTNVCDENKTIKEMIVYCVPQLVTTLLDTDLVCGNCLASIKSCVSFIETCLKVEAELLENQDDLISTNFDDGVDISKNKIPEVCRNISLDHNYTPDTISESVNTYETDPSAARHKCSKCNRTFKTKNYLLDHIRRAHSTNSKIDLKKRKTSDFDCDFCMKSFLTKLGFDLHLKLSHHGQTEEHIEECTICKDCGKKFQSIDELLEHEQEHGFTCKTLQGFTSVTDLNAHMENHPVEHLCDICGKGFKKKNNLKVHMLSHNDANAHLCHECGQGFKSTVSLNLHMAHHNPNLKFQCDLCPSSFHRKYMLINHKNVRHLGTKEYKCHICDKKFCYKSNMDSHYRLKHSEVKPYQCEKCGVRFARADYLKRHTTCGKMTCKGLVSQKRKYRFERGDEALVMCKLCDKVFKNIYMLRLHVKTHTMQRKYKCSKCNFRFTTSCNRDRHEKVHTDSSKLYRCEVCFKRMETQSALDKHYVSSHKNSKKYKCHLCEELFARKYLLHCHVAEQHGDIEDFEKEEEVLYKVVLEDYLIDNSSS